MTKQCWLMTNQYCFVAKQYWLMTKQFSFAQTNLFRDKSILLREKSMLIDDETMLLCDQSILLRDQTTCFMAKQCCFATNQCCFMTKQTVLPPNTIDSWRSRMQGRYADCDLQPATSNQQPATSNQQPDTASPLNNWLIFELQPARFFSLLQETQLRNKSTAYDINVIVLYKTCQEQIRISNNTVGNVPQNEQN
jgi:hypothetical protein